MRRPVVLLIHLSTEPEILASIQPHMCHHAPTQFRASPPRVGEHRTLQPVQKTVADVI